MAYFEVLNGPEVGQKTPIVHETFFIGRDPSNHLVISDRTVSRKHAVLNQIEDQYILSDLKSLKGVLVNGEKKEESILEEGDEIVLGAVRLRFFGAELSVSHVLPFRKRKGRRLFQLFLFLILLGGIVFVFLMKPQRFSLQSIQTHYEKGVELFNVSKDLEGAKKEWKKVLDLDPKKQTPYAQKAAQLLKKLKE